MTALSAIGVVALAAFLSAEGGQPSESPSPTLAHTQTEFHFTVHAGYEQTFPLFGALEEMKWAEGWQPHFVYPAPAHDQRGMVFITEHGGKTSTWVCTAFDPTNGYVQYAYVINDLLATQIDIHIIRAGAAETQVSVVYERTALSAAANEHVQQMAKSDESSGEEWGDAINGYLKKATAGR